MNVDWVIPCRYVEIHDNLGSIMGAGIDIFWVPDLPHPIQVAMAIRLTATADEIDGGGEHQVRNIVRGPDGQVVSDLGAQMQIGGGQRVERPEWLQGIVLSTLVQFMAEDEGTFTFEHIVDASSASVPLHVVHGPPPGAAPPV